MIKNTRKTGVNLLLAAEVLVLVAVLVLGIFYGAAGWLRKNNNNSNINIDNNLNNDNDVETEEDNTHSGSTVVIPNDYSEGRITFSNSVEEVLANMSVEQMVAQLFIVTPEALTGVSAATVFGNASKTAFDTYPVGGLVYSKVNFQNEEQALALVRQAKEYYLNKYGVELFTIIEEEGGELYSPYAAALGKDTGMLASELAALNNIDLIKQSAEFRADYLAGAEFNVNFSTIGDVASVIESDYEKRTYGTSVETVADFVAADISAMEAAGLEATLKYFPGKANAQKMENGILFSTETLEELASTSLLAFQAGIDAGASFVMIGNVIVPSITDDSVTPCSLSVRTVALLRETMGFTGVIVTDSFSDVKFNEVFGNGEACVDAINAGVDMIYMPADFAEAYQAVLEAVNNGEINADRLHNAVGRILTEKGL